MANFSDASEVRLRLTEDLPAGLTYATLSHCWGGADSKIPCLTTENYDDYLRHIVVASLPKVFRDAIALSRRLDIQFLWIDSLCIIQNSQHDWLEQAAIMGEVYQGSYLNIAATRSSDPSVGLFQQRNSLLATPLRVGIRDANAQPKALSRQQRLDDSCYELVDGTTLKIAIPQLPVKYSETKVDLNSVLGNNNGDFCPHGVDFALSAKNIQLHGDSLHAELRTISGEWTHSTICLRGLPGVSDKLPDVVQSFTLQRSSTLTITSPLVDETWEKICVDLDQYVGKENGQFTQKGQKLSEGARNLSLSGKCLSADLQNSDGEWQQMSLDIRTILSNLPETQYSISENDRDTETIFYDVGSDYYAQWTLEVTRAILCSRGWVIQERLLAPRVLHFGKQQLYFECVESRSVEQNPGLEIDCRQPAARHSRMDFKAWDVFSSDLIVEPTSRRLGVNYVWASAKAMFGRANLSFQKPALATHENVYSNAMSMCYGEDSWIPTHPLIRYWSAILISYSAARLTYEQDRLLAIAGVAKILSQRTAIGYVAGLWRYQLPRQLLWNNHRHAQLAEEDFKEEMHETSYIAPSWSPLSCAALLGSRGTTLDPLLETKGAMDLIKVIDTDVKGVLAQDEPVFGRIKDCRLRLRGRLLPVSLNMSAWPEGENRSKNLIQYWAGSTRQPPMGSVFLVPVLFTRWNERLPPSTANSLLLESTELAGVFRRVGVARLSSRCSLKDVVPQLYAAQNTYYEDEDDDADTEGEAMLEDLEHLPANPTSQPPRPNPQQELADARREMIGGSFWSSQLEALQKRAAGKSVSSTTQPATNEKLEKAAKQLSLLQAAMRATNAESAGKPGGKIVINPKEMQESMKQDMGMDVTVVQRRTMWTQKPVTMLKPKAAVGEHFYLRYEDDEDTARYGHFVFEII